jgi:molybdopterin molybdotransferase
MKFMDYDKSIEQLLKEVITIGEIELFISDSLGYVLAQDIVADSNSPAYPTSSMDGYAFKFEDMAKGRLKLLGDNPAGSDLKEQVLEGTAIKTFTGSLMPEGSDTLIPIELVTVEGDTVIFNENVVFGANVREVGENFTQGDILIQKGTTIGYVEIGIMASLNISHVKVQKKPVVATLSTGSEILDVGQEQTSEAQIRSSNHLVMEAIAKKHGAFVNQYGVVKDDKAMIIKTFKTALSTSDIVVSSGGVSVGDYDFVKDVIREELGAEVLFKGVAIKPGKHIMIAKVGHKFIIGLPGFAYSATVTFLLYVVPLIYKMQASSEGIKKVEAKLSQPFSKRSKFTEFTACNLNYINGEYVVDFEGKKIGSSAILTNMLDSTALMVTSPEQSQFEVGAKVEVLVI